jgi:hypothetical protein
MKGKPVTRSMKKLPQEQPRARESKKKSVCGKCGQLTQQNTAQLQEAWSHSILPPLQMEKGIDRDGKEPVTGTFL